MVEFTAPVSRFRDESLASLWSYHVIVPLEIAKPFLDADDRRVIVTFPNGDQKHCALMPRGEGMWYIFLNQQERKKLKVDVDDPLSLTLEADTSQYGIPVPDELLVLLDQDEEGNQFFHALTPGRQRTLINWVATVKNPDKRMTRALVMVNHVSALKGNVDFKQLNAEMKLANQR